MPRASLTTAPARHDARGVRAVPPADHAADHPPVWVPLPVAGERLSLHERTIRRAISAGELPGYRFGKALRVRLDELDAWAAAKVMPHARTLTKPAQRGASVVR